MVPISEEGRDNLIPVYEPKIVYYHIQSSYNKRIHSCVLIDVMIKIVYYEYPIIDFCENEINNSFIYDIINTSELK